RDLLKTPVSDRMVAEVPVCHLRFGSHDKEQGARPARRANYCLRARHDGGCPRNQRSGRYCSGRELDVFVVMMNVASPEETLYLWWGSPASLGGWTVSASARFEAMDSGLVADWNTDNVIGQNINIDSL